MDTEPENLKTFSEHLEDLRRTLIKSIFFLLVGIFISIPFVPFITILLEYPLLLSGVTDDPKKFLTVLEGTSSFVIASKVVLWTGFILSSPFVVKEIIWFVFPGLTEKERKFVVFGGCFVILMFIAGILISYFFIIPAAIKMLVGMGEWLGYSQDKWFADYYFSLILRMVLLTGIAFEFPVIIVILGIAGIINSLKLRKIRRYVIVCIMFVSMILTPPDVFSMILMAIPMIILYELCIWIVYFREKKFI